MARDSLNELPIGLLDFFGIKSMGQYPQQLGQQVVPVMDLLRWYADQRSLEIRTTAVTIVANTSRGSEAIAATFPVDITTGGELQVPQDETWLILEAFISTSYNTATSSGADYVLCSSIANLITNQTGMWNWPMEAITGFTSGDAAIIRSSTRTLTRPLFIKPGHVIRAFHHGILTPAGGVSWILGMKLLRLKR